MSDIVSAMLIEEAQRGNVVLFVGIDSPNATTGIPSRADLTRALAQRHNLDATASLARIAQQVGRGGYRREFTVFLREQLQSAQPQPFHRRVVDFVHEHGIKTLITTAYDDLLKRAFEAAGLPVEVVWKDSQLAVAFPDRPLLIQLYGNPLSDVESLVVTEDDHLGLWRDRSRESVLDEVKRALQRHTVLFLGYNLSDPDFLLLWREILSRAGNLHRRAFAVWPGLSEAEVGVWADRGIVILEEDPWGLVAGNVSSSQLPAPATIQVDHSSQDLEVTMPEAPNIPPQLYQDLQAALLRCGPFQNDSGLRPLFIDSRISAWRDGLPGANSSTARVQAVMDYLLPKSSSATGENALVLLMHVMRDQISRGDACYGQLEALANQLAGVVDASTTIVTPSQPTPPVPAASLSGAHKRQLIEALLTCPTVSNRSTRDIVVNDLPAEIRVNIRRNDVDRFDVSNIVTACLNYVNGVHELIEVVRFYEGNSIPMQTVDNLWRTLQ